MWGSWIRAAGRGAGGRIERIDPGLCVGHSTRAGGFSRFRYGGHWSVSGGSIPFRRRRRLTVATTLPGRLVPLPGRCAARDDLDPATGWQAAGPVFYPHSVRPAGRPILLVRRSSSLPAAILPVDVLLPIMSVQWSFSADSFHSFQGALPPACFSSAGSVRMPEHRGGHTGVH